MNEITLRQIGDRLMQCKDIPDQLVIEAVASADDGWAITAEVRKFLEARVGPVPWNLLLAKLRRLIARQLIDGCACGCSGGFRIPGVQVQRHAAAARTVDRWLAAQRAVSTSDVPAALRGPNWKARL
ncbi:hypothetical protein ACIA6C_27970 [Streptomyces sp. NPDC051578]|uniref:hypothetical protein n=1 Tax=Streptomyces sp. NPDC051578 TaxID=3365662 RepID=UPI0037AA5087